MLMLLLFLLQELYFFKKLFSHNIYESLLAIDILCFIAKYVSIYLSMYLSIYVSIYLCVSIYLMYLYIYLYLGLVLYSYAINIYSYSVIWHVMMIILIQSLFIRSILIPIHHLIFNYFTDAY